MPESAVVIRNLAPAHWSADRRATLYLNRWRVALEVQRELVAQMEAMRDTYMMADRAALEGAPDAE